MGFLHFLGATLAAIVLFCVGAFFCIIGLLAFLIAPSAGLSLGVNATQEVINQTILTGQIVGGVMGFIGIVMIIAAAYLKKHHM